MKKLSVLLVAAIMVLALTMPAAAFENEFGGFWRTRAFSQWNFTGEDQTKLKDTERIDTRTRLFYTAKFSDNLKFVNKFEMNATWGGSVGTMNSTTGTGATGTSAGGATYGQLAADGANFVVKASYVDFKLAQQRFTVGVQDFTLARGYLFDDDAAGVKAIFKVNDAIYLPLIYLKLYEGGQGKVISGTKVTNADDYDVDAYIFYPSIFVNKDNVIKPHIAYLTSENFSRFQTKSLSNAQLNPLSPLGATKLSAWTAGLEYDGKFDIFTVGATAIGEAGDVTVRPALANNHDKINLKGYLFDLRGGVDLGPANIHAKGIYASGDGKNDFAKTGDDYGFFVPGYNNNVGGNINNFDQANWAEIMGCGMFDYQFPNGALGTQISNAIIGGLGGSYKLIQDLKFSADLWYAQAADSIYMPTTKSNSDYYGTELDLKATYMLVDNLKLDLVGAYLWAGDVISKSTSANNSANPIEIGAQMSLAF
ncbi:MAG: hypothetical protein HY881_10875 [Deltaproteobacteria bacterium]|nr:hypothetical protein [Deltaproteobacteria bacterium]